MTLAIAIQLAELARVLATLPVRRLPRAGVARRRGR
jgi:hypothetical protein